MTCTSIFRQLDSSIIGRALEVEDASSHANACVQVLTRLVAWADGVGANANASKPMVARRQYPAKRGGGFPLEASQLSSVVQSYLWRQAKRLSGEPF